MSRRGTPRAWLHNRGPRVATAHEGKEAELDEAAALAKWAALVVRVGLCKVCGEFVDEDASPPKLHDRWCEVERTRRHARPGEVE